MNDQVENSRPPAEEEPEDSGSPEEAVSAGGGPGAGPGESEVPDGSSAAPDEAAAAGGQAGPGAAASGAPGEGASGPAEGEVEEGPAPEGEGKPGATAGGASYAAADAPVDAVAAGEAEEVSADGDADDEGRPVPTRDELVPLLEAVLFAAPEPVNRVGLQRICGEDVTWEAIEEALEELRRRSEGPDRGVQLVEVGGGWQLLTRPEFFPYVRRTGRESREEKLSPAALETLSVIAYDQPITRARVDGIRGVASGTLIRQLMDRRLVKVSGRENTPGSPFLYGTTRRFLEHFGLRSLRDLPDPEQATRILGEQNPGSVSG
jgi:segregation and condensation protein B